MNTTTQKVIEYLCEEEAGLNSFLWEWQRLPMIGATPIRRLAKFLANPYEALVLFLDAKEVTETGHGIKFTDVNIEVPEMNNFLLNQLEDGRGDDSGFGLNSSNNIMGEVEQG